MTFSIGIRLLCLTAVWAFMTACIAVGVQHDAAPSVLRVSPDYLTLYVPGEEGSEERFPSSSTVTASVLDVAGNILSRDPLQVRWEVSDRRVVSVEPSGRLTALATGTVTVRAATSAKNALEATMSVSVLDRGGAEVVVK